MADYQESTVRVENVQGVPRALQMTWHPKPTEADTHRAFAMVLEKLNTVAAPIHIMVDIRRNPSFPLVSTINGAKEVQFHPMMGNWLVLGSGGFAKLIARSITMVSRRNIEWFEDEAALAARLESLLADS